MKRLLAAALLLACLAPAALAADEAKKDEPMPPGPWQFESNLGVNVSQSAASSNWNGGDKSSVVWLVNLDTRAERQFSTRFNWRNTLKLSYGQSVQQELQTDGERTWMRPTKSADLIALESMMRWTLGGWADPYFALRLDSQFQDQTDPVGTIPFNPLRFSEAAGAARVFYKTDDRELISRVGFAFKENVGKSWVHPAAPLEPYKASFSTYDGGFEWKTEIRQPLLEKKVVYKGALLVYAPVYYSKSGALKDYDAAVTALDATHTQVQDYWRVPDVNFANVFTAELTKNFNVNLAVQFVYDKFDQATNVDPSLPVNEQQEIIERGVRRAGQFREVLALGLTFNLF